MVSLPAFKTKNCFSPEGGFGEGLDEEGVGGEGGGWDVGDDDLELPPDLVCVVFCWFLLEKTYWELKMFNGFNVVNGHTSVKTIVEYMFLQDYIACSYALYGPVS